MSTTTICTPYGSLHVYTRLIPSLTTCTTPDRDLESRADFPITDMRCLQLARTRDTIVKIWIDNGKKLNPIFVSLLVASLHDGTENPRSHRTVKVLWSDTDTESRWTVLREKNTDPLCIHRLLATSSKYCTLSMQVVPARTMYHYLVVFASLRMQN